MIGNLRRFTASALLHAGAGRGRVSVVSVLCALTASVQSVSPNAVNAASVIQVASSSAVAGGTGSFDVIFTNNTSTAVDVSNFSVQLSVPGGSGITFTGVDVHTTIAPYVFTTLQTDPLTFTTFPTTHSFVASDSYASFPGWVAVLAGQTVGLEHVRYSLASETQAGAVIVSISGLGTTTAILDQNDSVVTSSAINGSIRVDSASVPAPSSLLMGVIATISLIVVRRVWSAGRLATSPA